MDNWMSLINKIPLSLSFWSSQMFSNGIEQSLPPQSRLHSHAHSLWRLRQSPWLLQVFGQPSGSINNRIRFNNQDFNFLHFILPNVQCFPFHPVRQWQVPFLHLPCSRHLGSHIFSLHLDPVHPSRQRHWPLWQWPFGPQSRSQRSVAEKTSMIILKSWPNSQQIIYLESNQFQSISSRKYIVVTEDRKFHGLNNWANI